ncbi:MAG: lysophospholipid acyltransferase family protein [Planctomycetaceae bacterium]|nr:lysophospholipid acyltransferase family protein [Planctomycetaceae bacterium]
MKIRLPLLDRLAGLVCASLVRSWMSTTDLRVAYYDPTVDPVHPDWSGQKIYVFWHEYILLPLAVRGHSNLVMLLSQHHDAEILSHVAGFLGFGTVRGSTSRGGAAALRAMLRHSAHMNLTITPDGPRGPRRVLAPGPIYLASKLQMPLVLLGLGCDRPWRAKSWDRFAIPRPYSRMRAVVSPALHLPANLDRQGLEHYRQSTETLLNRLTLEAEAWAESGTRKVGEAAALRIPSPHQPRRRDPAHALRGPHSGSLRPALPVVAGGQLPAERATT